MIKVDKVVMKNYKIRKNKYKQIKKNLKMVI